MEKIKISISKDLYEEIKRRFHSTANRFNSIDNYIEYLLSYAVNNTDRVYAEHQIQMSEEEEIRERLKRLGYI